MADIRLAPPGKRVKCMLPDGSERADLGQGWAALSCMTSKPVKAEAEVVHKRPPQTAEVKQVGQPPPPPGEKEENPSIKCNNGAGKTNRAICLS